MIQSLIRLPNKLPLSKSIWKLKWKFSRSYDFYTDLCSRESSNNQWIENKKTRCIGLYQIGEMALADIGYYSKKSPAGVEKDIQYNNDWTGIWLGKNAINCKESFLNNREIQNIAIREYHRKVWDEYLKHYQHYQGKIIADIILSKAGMIAASHLVGFGKLIEFIESNGKMNPRDEFGTKCTEYLGSFSDPKYLNGLSFFK